jgi:hypothetical protein
LYSLSVQNGESLCLHGNPAAPPFYRGGAMSETQSFFVFKTVLSHIHNFLTAAIPFTSEVVYNI